MKKAIAFLNLIFLLSILFVVIYIGNGKFYPTLTDIEPAITHIKGLIQPTWHQPLLVALPAFWAAAFLLTLMVLREGPQAEKKPAEIEKPQETEADIKAECEKQKLELQEIIAGLEKEKESMRLSNGDLESQVKNLQAQLEKFSAQNGESEAEAALKKQLSELEEQMKKNQSENEKLQKDSAVLKDEKTRLATENEALISKVDKVEQEIKATRKESERNSSQLKSLTSDCEKKDEELTGLKSKLKELEEEIKSAQANVKGGKEAIPPAAYQILYLFQKEGRLIDLLAEDISELDDETLGGAIRPIHEGCRKLLEERLIMERVLDEEEGSEITLEEIDPEAIKLSGRVPASGPYKGELIHKGWRLKECNLPELVDGWKGNVIAPAEIEIS